MEGFGHGGMGMHRRDDVFGGGFEPDRQAELVDEFRCVFADDVGAEDLAPWLGRDDLHEAFRRAGGNGLAERREWKFSDLDIMPRCSRGGFGQAHRPDLRTGIGASGNGVVVHAERVVSSDPLDASHGGPMMSPMA